MFVSATDPCLLASVLFFGVLSHQIAISHTTQHPPPPTLYCFIDIGLTALTRMRPSARNADFEGSWFVTDKVWIPIPRLWRCLTLSWKYRKCTNTDRKNIERQINNTNWCQEKELKCTKPHCTRLNRILARSERRHTNEREIILTLSYHHQKTHS